MDTRNDRFPFRCVLSFELLIARWEAMRLSNSPVKAALADKMFEVLDGFPELGGPFEDLSILERRKDEIDALMGIVFPPATWDQDLKAAVIPFHLDSFYATPLYKEAFSGNDWTLPICEGCDEDEFEAGRLMMAYLTVLNHVYHLPVGMDYPLIFLTKDSATGLENYFRFLFNPNFCRIVTRSPVEPLTESKRKEVLGALENPERITALLPPENFEFHGFTVVDAVDVTEQEVLSAIKRDLIEKDSIFTATGFHLLEQRMRTLHRDPALGFGLAALQGDRVTVLNLEHKPSCGSPHTSLLFTDRSEFEGSVFHQAVEKGEPLLIENLAEHALRTDLENHFLELGVRSMYVAPLYYRGELLGTLDLRAPEPGRLNVNSAMMMWETLPLFSMALKRGMEELSSEIQTVIKEKCTAIHPSVEWRFHQAAWNFLAARDEKKAELEPIVFRDVYPLYGLSDIRGSSEHRNEAIQMDLIDHLETARQVMVAAQAHKPLPILDALIFRTDRHIEEIRDDLMSGDEVAMIDFIRREIEPLFDTLGDFGPDVQERIEDYRAQLDPETGALFERRREFEEAVTLINETVASLLDREQIKAQEYFPHYFEKMKTDGVDHSIYIGASMVEDGRFDMMYLRNLRLWQLMVMCEAVRKVEQIRAGLKLPLEVTHLILVQNTPLSIRFLPDEKRFSVHGAYDIRHEIVKKRIDKAVIKGANERLTQPGKIAVVYSHSVESREYRRYIEYLQAEGYLTDEIESLELDALQGVYGLKALRVTVDTGFGAAEEEGTVPFIRKAVEASWK